MTHDIVREAVRRIEAGVVAPASGVDTGLADIAFPLVLSHREPQRNGRNPYLPWGAYRRGRINVCPDVQTATLAAEPQSADWQPRQRFGTIFGELGDQRDRAALEARQTISDLLNAERDRAALNLAQRFKHHTRAPWAGSWTHGQRSWHLVSELLPQAVGYAVGTSLAHVGDDLSPSEAANVATGLTLLRQAGVWAFRSDVNGGVICVPEPSVSVNLVDEPHSDGAPAIQWQGAQSVWAYNGEIVPRAWITDPERITDERLSRAGSLPRTEVMLDIYGPERYVQAHGEVIDEGEKGKLWACDHPWQATGWGATTVRLRVVEVLNSTPEPDGSIRTYWLRVPGTTRSAQEGVAWTFGLTADRYRPLVET